MKVEGRDFSELEIVKDVPALVRRFSALAYEWEDDNASSRVTYKYGGKESVGGAQADKLTLAFSQQGQQESKLDIWIAADGKTVKWVQDGQEMSVELAAQLGAAMVQAVFWPFMWAESNDWYKTWGTIAGAGPWAVTRQGKESRKIGALNATVYKYQVKSTLTGQTWESTREVADFGQFSLFAGWEAKYTQGGKSQTSAFRLVDVALR